MEKAPAPQLALGTEATTPTYFLPGDRGGNHRNRLGRFFAISQPRKLYESVKSLVTVNVVLVQSAFK